MIERIETLRGMNAVAIYGAPDEIDEVIANSDPEFVTVINAKDFGLVMSKYTPFIVIRDFHTLAAMEQEEFVCNQVVEFHTKQDGQSSTIVLCVPRSVLFHDPLQSRIAHVTLNWRGSD